MRYFLIFCSLLSLSVQAQFSRTPRDPGISGVYNLGRDPSGVWVEITKNGAIKAVDMPVYMAVSAVRSLSLVAARAPKIINRTDTGGGIYVLDAADTSSPDNTGTVVVTANGLRYKLTQPGPVGIEQFGVVYNDFGSAAANTAALTKAIASGRALTAQLAKAYTAGSVTAVAGTTIQLDGNGVTFEHITQNDLFDFSNGVSGTITDLNINAGINMTGLDAVGLRIKCQPGRLPGIVLDKIKVSRAGGDIEWGKGIVLIDPDNAQVHDITIDGRGDASLGATTPTFVGLDVSCTRAAVSGVFRNIKVYSGGLYGVYLRSSTQAGLEGMEWTKCDMVGMDYGYDFESTADYNTYIPTQFTFTNNHAEVKKTAFKLRNFIQVVASNNLFYVKALANRLGTGMQIENCSQSSFVSNKVFNTGDGPCYGAIFGGQGMIEMSLVDFTVGMGTGSGSNAAVILFSTCNKSFVDNIKRTGGGNTVTNLGTDNVVGRTFNAGVLE
ncbi:hypothetical protein [Spirosoma sp. 209]|uniref:hypothetical protein n=1 Tax=Spirosoma sp. 209 TaxID=1955701 RepID=UPI00098CFC0E|nr:hypothetical protein [Spirosoma sp. 209]